MKTLRNINAFINTLSEKQLIWAIFMLFFSIRLAYFLLSPSNCFDLQLDSYRYNHLAQQLLQGNDDFNILVFIPSPLIIYVFAFFQYFFGQHYILAMAIFQLILSACSGVYLYKISLLLFRDKSIALLTALLYAFFPLTLYWVFTLSQDTFFQCFLIFFVYYFLKSIFSQNPILLVFSALLYGVVFMTKSHILLGSFFLPLAIWFNTKGAVFKKLSFIAIFTGISLLCTLPFGLFTLKKYDTYVISSTGIGCHFLGGHNDDYYRLNTNPPPLNSPEYIKLLDNYDYAVYRPILDTIDLIPVKDVQSVFLKEGIKWCQKETEKFCHVTWLNIKGFFMPGVNPLHYSLLKWWMAFLVSLPVYILAYMGIYSSLKNDFPRHSYFLSLFISLFLLSVVFYTQNRFRTITLEPFYLMYAAYTIRALQQRIKNKSSFS